MAAWRILLLVVKVNAQCNNPDLFFFFKLDSFSNFIRAGGFGRPKKVPHRDDFQPWSRSITIGGMLYPFRKCNYKEILTAVKPLH